MTSYLPWDDGKITALVLLDLSAAFDTVDHKILLSRLQYYLGIHGISLDWWKSYLINRPQHVCIGNAISKPVILDYSVPQGSVLGPQWFTVYTFPVRDIILKYNINYHVYADDTQLYITFKSSQEPADSCITTLEKFIQDIRSWMRQNFLKLNDEKVYSIWIASPIIKRFSSIYYNWWLADNPLSSAWNQSATFSWTRWLKIIPHMIRSYYYRCCCRNDPVFSSHCVHLKLGHRFYALLKVCSDRDDTVPLTNGMHCL